MSRQGLMRGRVSFAAHETYRVLLDHGGEAAAEPSGALRAYGSLPVVGDWVWMRPTQAFSLIEPAFSLIEEVEERRTAFIRRAAGRAHASQCLAANVDVCFVVCGLDDDFNLRRIERYLVLAWESGARPVVVLNKADLCGDVDAALSSVRSIAGAAQVIAISARQSVDPLIQQLSPGSTAVLVGSSGAGKSTIANALTAAVQPTQEVRQSDSRGRHTTTASLLLSVPGGAWLIDSPGLRELGLLASETSLDAGFPEIAELAAQCRFGDCLHQQEPGCAVRQALEQDRIPADRWASYTKLRREARHAAIEADVNSQLAEKRKWKAIHKAAKRLYRDRDRET